MKTTLSITTVFLSLHLGSVPSIFASSICLQSLKDSNQSSFSHPEDQIFAYLAQLVERGRITWDEAPAFLESIRSGKPFPLSQQNDFEIQFFIEGLSTLLEQRSVQLDHVTQKISMLIQENQAAHHRREQVARSTRTGFQPLEWIILKKGDFSIGHRNAGYQGKHKTYRHRLTRSFEISNTVVTIGQWYEVMKTLPSPYQSKASEFLNAKGNPKEGAPFWNLPVIEVKWIDAIKFLNRLSTLQGLKPAYQILIDDPDTFHTTAEVQSEDGSIYTAEGYRLPTHVEWEYVRSLGGRFRPWTAPYPDRNRALLYSKERYDYSPSTEVAELQPFLIQGQPIYDLFGFLHEHLHDSWHRPYGTDDGLTIDHEVYNSASSYSLNTHTKPLYVELHASTDMNYRQTNNGRKVGFRIVRTLGGKEPKR